jgi:hypothetical protein
MTEAALLML